MPEDDGERGASHETPEPVEPSPEEPAPAAPEHSSDRSLDDDPPTAAAGPERPRVSPNLQIERGWRGVGWQIAFPAVVVVLALAVPVVAWVGRAALLESRGGRPAETVTDPDVPGFEAAVEPTPTMLVVQVADDGRLTGLTLLAQTGPTTGSVLFIPVDVAVEAEGLDLGAEPTGGEPEADEPEADEGGADEGGGDEGDTVPTDEPTDTTTDSASDTASDTAPDTASDTASDTAPPGTGDAPPTGPLPLSDVYELGGVPAVTTGVESLIGIGVGDRTVQIEGDEDEEPEAVPGAGDDGVEEVTVARWAELVEPLAPLTVANIDPVVVDEGGTTRELFPSGQLTLEAGDVGRYLEALGPEESELNRTVRHQAFWLAWLESIGASDDPGAVPGELDVGLGGFVRALAARTVRFYTVPVTTLRIPDTADEVFVANEEELAEIMVEIVPFPVGSDVDPRTRVRVLDGTGTPGASLAAAEALVEAGAEIVLLGNAAEFGHAETDIVYYDPALEDAAQRFAEALGGATTAFADEPGEVVEVTVVVGQDFVSSADLAGGGVSVETVPEDEPDTGQDGEGGDDG